jgi:hypothetical protein
MASGINSTFRQVGIATGTAALGAVFSSKISSEVSSSVATAPAQVQAHSSELSDAISSGAIHQATANLPPPIHDHVVKLADQAFISGLNEILVIGAIVAAVGGVLALVMVRQRDFLPIPQAQPEVEGEPVAA